MRNFTDGHGRTVDFRNTIVVMTSNIGGNEIQELAEGGANDTEIELKVRAILRQHFRPEFLNRIDDVVTFHALSLGGLARIVELQLEEVRARLADRKITLALTDAAVERLSLDGFDPVFGARPLKRMIQREVVDRVAKALIEGRVHEGDTVRIGVGADGDYEVE